MERITIELADDGRVTVMAESPGEELEQMEFDNVAEAADAVRSILMDAEEDAMAPEPAMPGDQDAEAMWNEEASRRPPQMGLMA